MTAPLLKTKLYIPPARPSESLVSRPRLIERLNQGIRPGSKLILVSAPAGFGKTTLLSEWTAGRTHVAWVSLDPEDNDLTRFLTYLVAAIQAAEPGLGGDVLAMMQSPQPSAVEMMLTGLLNGLADCPGPLVLVLDDYHEITADSVQDALLFLLDHLPPHVHLIITTRIDPPWPLARLRSRREMIELRAPDLRFTLDETAAFLNNVMGLGLAAESITALDVRTEGWIAGLQMAALSMQGGDAARAAAFIQAFSGSHRFVLDYLVEEVLERQSDEIQAFLLQTSILDRLTAPLCDAVLGVENRETAHSRPDSQAILVRLERANLFLVPLDDERRWYRYHPLFADLLRRRLQATSPEQVSANLLRASAWYESQGSIPEAISRALEAAGYDRVADLLERYGGQLFRRGESWRIGRWMEALPEEMVRSRSLLCLARAWTLSGVPDAADRAVSWLERALALSAANPRPLDDPDSPYHTDRELIAENARLFRIGIAQQKAGPDQVIALCLEALEALPKEAPSEEAVYAQSVIAFYLAQAYRRLDDREAAAQALAQARQLGLAAEGHVVALVVAGIQAGDAWDRGDLQAAAEICQETIISLIQPAEQASGRVPSHACLIYVFLGRTLVEWNELERAEPLLIRGVELAEQIAESVVQVDGCCDLARLHWMQGNFQAAHAWLDKAVQACRRDPAYLHALRARVWLAQGENDPCWLGRASEWADEIVPEGLEEPGWELQSLVRVRMAQYRAYGEPDLTPVLAVLDRHLETPAAMSSRWQVEILTLKALLLQILGRTEAAMSPLARALAAAKTTGQVLAFLEHGRPMVDLLHEGVRRQIEAVYARQILAAFEVRGCVGRHRASPEARPSPQAALVEPLSERELQVLYLLSSALSQQEIADQLVLSVNTIRSHVKHVYAKLGVHGRIEALARAQELGLL